MSKAGVPAQTVQRVMRHKSFTTTMGYLDKLLAARPLVGRWELDLPSGRAYSFLNVFIRAVSSATAASRPSEALSNKEAIVFWGYRSSAVCFHPDGC